MYNLYLRTASLVGVVMALVGCAPSARQTPVSVPATPALTIDTATGAEVDPLHARLRLRYRELYSALRPDADPVFVEIEHLERTGSAAVTTRARVVTVTRVDAEPAISYELRRDRWSLPALELLDSTRLSPPAEGEMIPSVADPRSVRLQHLADRVRVGDRQAVEEFWREAEGRMPLVEPIANDPGHSLVTFVWRGGSDIARVSLYGELPYPPWDARFLTRIPETDVWYRSMRIPSDTRTTYGFDLFHDFLTFSGDTSTRLRSFVVSVPDPRNPRVFNEGSVLELPGAPPQEWIAARPDVPKGALTRDTIHSQLLAEPRVSTIYTPAGFTTARDRYPVVVLFDGPAYGSGTRPVIPTPTILDNLIADGRIPPVIAVLVHHRNREAELSGSPQFTRYLAEELIPSIAARFHGTRDPARVVVGGSSLGGLAGAFAAVEYPQTFGNVLSQSGAFWLPRDPRDPVRREYIPPEIWFVEEVLRRPRVPVRFWMEVSRFESAPKMLGPNRQLRDVLRASGYQVTYREFHGGHDYLHWRGSLADALIDLLGGGSTGSGGP
jgi:enterochelin esterase-like enzyme